MRTGLQVLGWLTAVAAVGCIAKGNVGGFLGMVVFAVISFWRATCKTTNGGFEFLGFLFAFFASGGMIMVAQHGARHPYPLILVGSIILAVVFFVLCDRKKDEPKTNVSTDKPITNEATKASAQPTTAKMLDYQYWNETIYNRLKRLCNPANFVDNYDKEKIDIANSIYSKLMETNPDDNEAIDEIVNIAEKELKTNLLDEYQFIHLKNKLNPKNFMAPYDAEKVTLANELYSQLMQPDLNYTKYINIKNNAESLLKIIEEKEEETAKANAEEERHDLQWGIIFACMVILFVTVILILSYLGIIK